MGNEVFDPQELLKRQLQRPLLGMTPASTGTTPDATPITPPSIQLGRAGLSTSPADLPVTPSTEPRLTEPKPYDPRTTQTPAQDQFREGGQAGEPHLGGWKKGLDIAGQFVVPRLEAAIPGTPGHYRAQQDWLGKEASTEAALGRTGAETKAIEAEVPLRKAQTEGEQELTRTREFERTHPEPKEFTPGSQAFDRTSQTFSTVPGDAPAKGAKSEELEFQENMPIGWRDIRGIRHSLTDPNTPPAILEQAKVAGEAHARALKEQEEKESRVAERGAQAQARGFAHQDTLDEKRADRKTKEGVDKAFSGARDADVRADIMRKASIRAKQGDQQAMLMLTNQHVMMTLGIPRGKVGRVNQTQFEDAARSAPALQRAAARFDSRGYLMGVALSPEQIDEMVKNSEDVRQTEWKAARREAGNIDPNYAEPTSIFDEAKGGGPTGVPSPRDWLARKRGRKP